MFVRCYAGRCVLVCFSQICWIAFFSFDGFIFVIANGHSFFGFCRSRVVRHPCPCYIGLAFKANMTSLCLDSGCDPYQLFFVFIFKANLTSLRLDVMCGCKQLLPQRATILMINNYVIDYWIFECSS